MKSIICFLSFFLALCARSSNSGTLFCVLLNMLPRLTLVSLEWTHCWIMALIHSRVRPVWDDEGKRMVISRCRKWKGGSSAVDIQMADRGFFSPFDKCSTRAPDTGGKWGFGILGIIWWYLRLSQVSGVPSAACQTAAGIPLVPTLLFQRIKPLFSRAWVCVSQCKQKIPRMPSSAPLLPTYKPHIMHTGCAARESTSSASVGLTQRQHLSPWRVERA